MKTIKFLIACLVLSQYTNAQKVKVSWGEESKVELAYGSMVKGEGQDMIKLCFENHRGGLFGTKSTSTPILARYDKKLSEQGLRSFEVNEDNVKFDELLSVKSNLYMFTNRYDNSSKTTSFYVQKIDAKTLNPKGRLITLGTMAALTRSNQSDAGYEISKDSTKILMFGVSPTSKKENEKYYMAVFDYNMNKLWEKTVVLPYLDKYVDILDYTVTNSGSVGIMIKHYDKEIKKEKVREDGANVPAYKAKFLLYANDQATPKEFVLDLKDKFVHTLQVTADENNNLSLFGLYKNKYDGYVNGYFLAQVSTVSGEPEVKKIEAFPETMIDLIKKDKQGSNRERDPGLSSHFVLADVMERGDGSMDYILEYYTKVLHENRSTNMSTGYTSSTYYYVYTYGDVVDVHVNGQAPTQFVRIPKLQITTETKLYSSFKAVTVNNKLVLFYNDDRDNVERDIEKKPDDMIKFTKSILAMAVVDAKGNLTRSEVYDHKEMKLTTCINVSQRIDNNKIGLYAQKAGGLFSSSKDMIGLIEVN